MKKKNYEAHVFDIVTAKTAIATGTNKETVMRCAAGMARNRKTKYHWKNKIFVYANLYDSDELKKDETVPPILSRRF
jgi:hypothetical protein